MTAIVDDRAYLPRLPRATRAARSTTSAQSSYPAGLWTACALDETLLALTEDIRKIFDDAPLGPRGAKDALKGMDRRPFRGRPMIGSTSPVPSATAYAVGGIASAAADFDKAANQVVRATTSTPAYEVSLSNQAASAGNQAASTGDQAASAGNQAASADPDRDGDRDLAKAMVDMDVAKYRVAANVKVIQASDQMVGTLLSMTR